MAAVLDGSAGDTVYRKLRTSIDLVLMGPHTVAALVLVVLLIVSSSGRPRRSGRPTRVGLLRVALISVVVISLIGCATNDSSVAIPLVAGLVAVPAVLAICARVRPGSVVQAAVRDGGTGATPVPPATQDTPVAEVTRPDASVTVNSRGRAARWSRA